MASQAKLISDDYRRLNIDLHAQGQYGLHGRKWATKVTDIAQAIGAATILDYGCGQGSLRSSMNLPIAEYDPAIKGKDSRPEAADLVVCTDVLEHIEPDYLNNVIDDLHHLSIKALFAVISTRPAKKFLADGRNAHLIVQPQPFWKEIFSRRFKIVEWEFTNDEVIALLLK